MAAMSLQGFLITWMLVGILEMPADRVGFGRMVMELPPLAILLLGGIVADRMDGRTLLARMHVLIALPPLCIAGLVFADSLSFWTVVAFGVAMSSLQSVTDPARQALLSRVARIDIQRTVTLMTIVTSLAGLAGVWLGGQLDRIGLERVLVIQSLCFFAGMWAVRQLPSYPVRSASRPDLFGGVKAVWRAPLIRDIIALNFLSSLFNAGAYVVAVPFIVKEVYGGGAEFFATVIMIFTAGSIGSNVILLRYMPLLRPGRLFLLLQLTRVVILGVLLMRPNLLLFHAAILAWGFNMGITTTLVRTTVQELASESHRAQILSVLLLSFMVSAPVSSILLGWLIAGYDPLTALVPGIVMSIAIFALGTAVNGLWRYEAEAARTRSLSARAMPRDAR